MTSAIIDAMHSRNSVSQLEEPGPSAEQLENILKAGLRANDHRRLRPWKFLVMKGEARKRLGEIFVAARLAENSDFSTEEQEKLAAKPLRAPVIITVVAKVRSDEKVPDIEQVISAGGSAQLMSLAAHALGVGAVWRTGSLAYNVLVHKRLGLEEGDQIVGFLYLGTPKNTKPLAELALDDFVINWQG